MTSTVNLTKATHRTPYPGIDPLNPQLSKYQNGRSILITGGGAGIGLAISRAFVLASAARVIIIGRRPDVLNTAVSEFRTLSNKTEILSRVCDITNPSDLKSLWSWLETCKISIDTLILNAGVTQDTLSFLSNPEDVWKFFEGNVLANLRLTRSFLSQGSKTGKVLINISTAGIHQNPTHPGNASYNTTKLCFTAVLQPIADEVKWEECQIVSVHPGIIVTEATESFKEAKIPWSDGETLLFCSLDISISYFSPVR